MKNIIVLLLTLSLSNVFAQLDSKDSAYVTNFIALLVKNDTHALASKTRYPLERPYPLSSIKDSAEFVLRFNELFDQNNVRAIVASNPKEDWSHFGWRGISLQSEQIWLDEDGWFKGGCYFTEKATKKAKKILLHDRQSVHPSLREFENPVLLWSSESYTIRIDQTKKGYRYASWSKGKKLSDKPDLILFGTHDYSGSGGYRDFNFISGIYKYNVGDSAVGPNVGDLTVYKNDVEILSQSCYEIELK